MDSWSQLRSLYPRRWDYSVFYWENCFQSARAVLKSDHGQQSDVWRDSSQSLNLLSFQFYPVHSCESSGKSCLHLVIVRLFTRLQNKVSVDSSQPNTAQMICVVFGKRWGLASQNFCPTAPNMRDGHFLSIRTQVQLMCQIRCWFWVWSPSWTYLGLRLGSESYRALWSCRPRARLSPFLPSVSISFQYLKKHSF